MKKFNGRDFICGILIGSLFISGFSYASSQVKLIVNGKEVVSDVPPQVIEGRTMVPARFLAESLGANVKWDESQTAVIVTSKSEEKKPVIKTEHISFPMEDGWIFQKGLNSYVIKKGEKTIGSLNLLGYSPSIESLLPNGAEILDKKELSGISIPTKAVKLITRSSAADPGPELKEIHYLYYLEDNKLVYDLSFQLDSIDEDSTLRIAQSVIVQK